MEGGGTGTDEALWSKRRNVSMALTRGGGLTEVELRSGGVGEPRVVNVGWPGIEDAVVKRISASIALLRG